MFSNYSSGAPMQYLLPWICPSPQKQEKIQAEVYSISKFLIKSLINKNCLNSRTIYDIGMKLESLSKLGKRNTTTLKKIKDNVMPVNYDIIVIILIYG